MSGGPGDDAPDVIWLARNPDYAFGPWDMVLDDIEAGDAEERGVVTVEYRRVPKENKNG